jgi:glycosyltransferase involved in cell wall biosynthesis
MISVITPVYNAELYLQKTIESVLIQPEVSEHILIDDGSSDKSWEIIQNYVKKDKRVIGLKHPDHCNHGRSKTRNLGINQALNKWIAFLDADDFYLKNRFKNDLVVITNDSSIDGVYNAIGIYFYDSYAGSKDLRHALTTIKEKIEPEHLFDQMNPYGNKGWFSGDGFLVKKEKLLEVGGFNERLEVAEDTELWSKLSLTSKLIPGLLEVPVAKRGVHGTNVFINNKKYTLPRLLMFLSLMKFVHSHTNSEKRRALVMDRYLKHLSKFSNENTFIFLKYWVLGVLTSHSTIRNKKFYKLIYRKVMDR